MVGIGCSKVCSLRPNDTEVILLMSAKLLRIYTENVIVPFFFFFLFPDLN